MIEEILKYLRSTKNKHVYAVESLQANIPQIYIDKKAFTGEAPKKIKITVEVVDK